MSIPPAVDEFLEYAHIAEWFRELFSPHLPNWAKWLVLSGVFFFVELSHGSWVVLWFALAALVASGVSVIAPGNVILQITTFFGTSVLLFAFARPFAQRILFPDEPRRSGLEHLIGKTGVVSEVVMNSASPGVVKVLGSYWKAEVSKGGMAMRKGDVVRVIGVDGIRLIVEPVKDVRELGSPDDAVVADVQAKDP